MPKTHVFLSFVAIRFLSKEIMLFPLEITEISFSHLRENQECSKRKQHYLIIQAKAIYLSIPKENIFSYLLLVMAFKLFDDIKIITSYWDKILNKTLMPK